MSLQDAGVLTASEWSDALGAAIKRAQAHGDPDIGNTYYHHVLDALETLMQEKGVIATHEFAQRKAQWIEAYAITPHGRPVALRKIDLS